MKHLLARDTPHRIWDYLVCPPASSEPTVVAMNDGGLSLGKHNTLCLFAHFDLENHIHPHVRHHLKALRELGCDTVFVSASENLPRAEIQGIQGEVSLIIQRRNKGLDFGSWYTALGKLPSLHTYGRLIFANDSVYGPLYDLGQIFDEMAAKNYDVWGITESREIRWHIQSYFLVLNRSAMNSAAFAEFWKTFRFFRNKNNIINCYEIGLSRHLREAGFRVGSYCGPMDNNTNPSLREWKRVVSEMKCPYLKTAAVRNALRKGTSPFQVIEAHTDYDVSLIKNHLAHVRTEK